MPHNPSWTEEEIILGLDTYFRTGRSGLNANNAEVIALSELLNRLPFHSPADREGTFRNPVGVAMTLRKFLHFDPEYEGEGLRPESGLKQAVWKKFVGDREELRQAAAAIRADYERQTQKSKGVPMQDITTTAACDTSPTIGRPKDKALGWIRFMRQYGPISRNDSAFEEHTLQAALRAGVEPILFEHPRLQDVLNSFGGDPGKLRSVILTGTAGDGKTHLCRQVWELLGGDRERWHSDDSYLPLMLPSGTTVHVIRDLSAWVPLQGDDWKPEETRLLELFCRAMFGEQSSDCFLIAANDGQLVESWRRLPGTPDVLRARELFETLLVEDRQEEPGVRLWFYNLSRGSSAELLDRALVAFLCHDGWKACFEGESGQRVAFNEYSPIRRNHQLLSSPLLQNRLRDLFELCDYNGLHIPIREILALLSNAILGHPDCRDRLMQPGDVSKIIEKGTVAKASLYSNLFGGNLSEARRDSIGVFNYLGRFRIGQETTNRIDNLLIFGEADEGLRSYFDRFLASDTFYGADSSYRASQNQYVEGVEEDESKNTAFLDMLVAQRRALFFKITEAEVDELHLWDLTVFRYAGEYLNNVVRLLQGNGRVDRAILGRLVRGLNRVFVGMLVTSDRELCLGTNLHSTGARVSRIYEEVISVPPRLGERVDITWGGNMPTLSVALTRDISCAFPLNLVRYEFLSRVAEGALPGSFSKECYEDVLSFKSRILAALTRRREQDGSGDPTVLEFRRLILDDNGNPFPKTIEVTYTPDVAPVPLLGDSLQSSSSLREVADGTA